MRRTLNNAVVTAIQSGSAAIRLREARRFLERFEPGAEVLLLGASRGAVDDLARAISMERGATFGLHRLSFTQLAAAAFVLRPTDFHVSRILETWKYSYVPALS
jgi:hypothetical protein